jgi:16S rRNA (guanine527-N7)-methyltransferase
MEVLHKYFPDLSRTAADQFSRLRDLYSFWNERINLISRRDFHNLYLHHVLHSLAIAKVFSFKAGAKILDAGTGGGFPGVPLAIFFPEVEFCLADSIEKKIRAVQSITSGLGLSNTTVLRSRIEDLNEKYDFIVCRAVTSLQTMIPWFSMRFNEVSRHSFCNGLVCLKGGDITDEVKKYGERITVFPIGNFFDEPYFETKKIIYLAANEWPE